NLLPGARVVLGQVEGDWIEARLEGWIYNQSTDPDRREGFDLVVTARPTENIRVEPNGTIIAKLVTGTLLERRERRGAWTRVRRVGWIPRSAASTPATASADTGTAQSTPIDASRAPAVDRARTAGEARLLLDPEGESLATLAPGVRTRIVARSGEWTRVQIEGWVRQDQLEEVPDSLVLTGVSAAEVRAEPERYVGRVLEWRVQFLSVRQADELRPEIPLGQPYLLTRGPLPEAGFVYIQVNAEQAERFRQMEPLAEVTVRGELKAAETRYLPNPVLVLRGVVSE
ncbi:MAG: hypothetical protein ACREL6_10275, partial [Gemmatimonadales bacterium]